MSFLPPLLLHYYITERCNCRCSFCDIWKSPAAKSNDARLETVLTNVRQAKKLGVRFVDFTGGEPLLHDELPQMLKEAKRLYLKTTITTNALRYPNRAAELAGLVDFLHFSLDGLNAETHDAIRGQQTFSTVMHSLDKARDVGEIPDLLFTVSHKNVNHLHPMVEFAQKLKLMLIVNPVFAYSSLKAPHMDILKKVESFTSTPFVYVNKAFHRLRRRGGNNIKAPRCRVMDSTIVISPDNHVVLPCYHFQQVKQRFPEAHQTNESPWQFQQEKQGLLIERGSRCRQKRNSPRNNLAVIRKTSTWRHYYKNQGRFDFCQGCHLNCYFDPSFFYKIDEYLFLSALAKSRYWWDKNVRRRLSRQSDTRPAVEIAKTIMEKYDRL